MKDKIYLSDMPMLFFQNLPSGFVAAFKQFWDLPKIVKANNLTTPNHFIILPRGFMPDLGIPYLAKKIELDERIPHMVLGKKTCPVFPMGSFFIFAIKLSAKKSDYPAKETELALVRFYETFRC